MEQYYDPTRDQAYHHNADNCGIHTNKKLNGIKIMKNPTRKFKQDRLPSLKVYSDGKKTNNKFGLTIGWRGIEEYFKQCKRTESESKKAAQFHTP